MDIYKPTHKPKALNEELHADRCFRGLFELLNHFLVSFIGNGSASSGESALLICMRSEFSTFEPVSDCIYPSIGL